MLESSDSTVAVQRKKIQPFVEMHISVDVVVVVVERSSYRVQKHHEVQ